jgi:NAD(P)-dependent dehydrogenase (short-subunit alcohol dehydrogenase family)
MKTDVVVVIGIGGIGQAIARRQGFGKTVLVADFDEAILEAAATGLEAIGYEVTAQFVDVSSRESVRSLAKSAARLGSVMQVVHTAGLSPNMAPAEKILAVDLLGVALVLEELGRVIASGGAAVVISSMAGYMPAPLPQEQDEALARTPADDLLKLPFLQPNAVANSMVAYSLSKRANNLRVQAASVGWGERGARVNSISPGIIATPLAQHEMASSIGAVYRSIIETSSSKRIGTPEEVASAASYLLGPESTFVTGSDLLIDGGVIAAMRSGRMKAPV